MSEEYKLWYIHVSPPECGGTSIVSCIEVRWIFAHWPPDNDEYFATKEEAIDLTIKRLLELRDEAEEE